MPERVVQMWEAWLDEQWNRPSRTDHYIMQSTLSSGRSYKDNVGLKDLRIRFGESSKISSKRAGELEGENIRRFFLGAFGIRPDDGGWHSKGETGEEVGT